MPPKPLRWAIIGPGRIANKFTQDLQLVDDVTVTAVASRNLQRALDFAEQYDIPNAYGDYREAWEDPDVDIVYIATPHHAHHGLGIEAMKAGKHLLCEKPLAVNKRLAEEMIRTAREQGVFLMEGMWSRFNPGIRQALEHIRRGAIGEVNYVNADFCFHREVDPDSRLFNAELAGGALLDIGIYPIFLAYMIFGYPEEVRAVARLSEETGVDLQTMAILRFRDGLAHTMSGFSSRSDMTAMIYGTAGHIAIDSRWHEAQGYRIESAARAEHISLPTPGNGFTYEIEECRRCVSSGKTESEKWSHRNSLDLISIADEVRRQIGLRYPFES